jgi:valyl-tRNA synthetase
MCAGREKFMQEVFKWVDQYGNTIFSQLRRIGSSLDWSRQVLLLRLHDMPAS